MAGSLVIAVPEGQRRVGVQGLEMFHMDLVPWQRIAAGSGRGTQKMTNRFGGFR